MIEYVYFLQMAGGGPIKIGWSVAPELRLSQCEAWSPYPLELMCSIQGGKRLERNIQDCFADCHFHHEWFHPVERLTRAIALLARGVSVHEAIDLTDIRGNSLRQVQLATTERRLRRTEAAA